MMDLTKWHEKILKRVGIFESISDSQQLVLMGKWLLRECKVFIIMVNNYMAEYSKKYNTEQNNYDLTVMTKKIEEIISRIGETELSQTDLKKWSRITFCELEKWQRSLYCKVGSLASYELVKQKIYSKHIIHSIIVFLKYLQNYRTEIEEMKDNDDCDNCDFTLYKQRLFDLDIINNQMMNVLITLEDKY